MAVYYLDTSALVKLYVEELGTSVVIGLASDLNNDQLAILDLARIEFRAAVRRRERSEDIAPAQTSQLLSQFEEHLVEIFLTQPSNASVVEEACRLQHDSGNCRIKML